MDEFTLWVGSATHCIIAVVLAFIVPEKGFGVTYAAVGTALAFMAVAIRIKKGRTDND